MFFQNRFMRKNLQSNHMFRQFSERSFEDFDSVSPSPIHYTSPATQSTRNQIAAPGVVVSRF